MVRIMYMDMRCGFVTTHSTWLSREEALAYADEADAIEHASAVWITNA